MHQINHLNLEQNIRWKYMINLKECIIPTGTLNLKWQY